MKFMLVISSVIWHVNNADVITNWGFFYSIVIFVWNYWWEFFIAILVGVFFIYFFSDFQVVESTGFIDLCLINCKKREVRTPYDHLLLKQNTLLKNW
jgi:hypothetical protein